MAHNTAISSAMFSSIAVAAPATHFSKAALDALDTQAEFDTHFATEIANVGGTRALGAFVMMNNIKEFPEMGIPANIVKVPVYGQPMSFQVNAQADAPTLEFTVNHVEADWDKATAYLGGLVGTGQQVVMRFATLSAKPATQASAVGGLGTTANSYWYWVGRIDARTVATSLSDANTSKVTLTMQTQFFGAYTV